jgi:glycosyltransferase involved in cell wall biosynthesis
MVFAGCEDFGIAMAEAQAAGTPLLAFGRGGARDIVRPLGRSEAPTGILFNSQSIVAVKDVVERFERDAHLIRPEDCSANAARFSEEQFDQAILRSAGSVQATFADC